MSFRLNFLNSKDPFGACDIGRSNCDTSLIHSPCANVIDPGYSLDQFPCAENV